MYVYIYIHIHMFFFYFHCFKHNLCWFSISHSHKHSQSHKHTATATGTATGSAAGLKCCLFDRPYVFSIYLQTFKRSSSRAFNVWRFQTFKLSNFQAFQLSHFQAFKLGRPVIFLPSPPLPPHQPSPSPHIVVLGVDQCTVYDFHCFVVLFLLFLWLILFILYCACCPFPCFRWMFHTSMLCSRVLSCLLVVCSVLTRLIHLSISHVLFVVFWFDS